MRTSYLRRYWPALTVIITLIVMILVCAYCNITVYWFATLCVAQAAAFFPSITSSGYRRECIVLFAIYNFILCLFAVTSWPLWIACIIIAAIGIYHCIKSDDDNFSCWQLIIIMLMMIVFSSPELAKQLEI